MCTHHYKRETCFLILLGHKAVKILTANASNGGKYGGERIRCSAITMAVAKLLRDGILVYLLLVKIKEPSVTCLTPVSHSLTIGMVAH